MIDKVETPWYAKFVSDGFKALEAYLAKWAEAESEYGSMIV